MQAQNKQTGDEATTAAEYLTFTLGQEEYAIDILKVQEIRGYEQPTLIANAQRRHRTNNFTRVQRTGTGLMPVPRAVFHVLWQPDGLIHRLQVLFFADFIRL